MRWWSEVKTWAGRVDPGWLVAALLPLIGFLPTIGQGLSRSVINGADGPFQVHRIYTMSVMLADGQLWARWVPYYHLGFGYPIFNYYPPGVSYLGGLLVLLGLTPAAAFNLVTLFSWIVGSVGTYVLARDLLPAPSALLAALLWAYAPSRLAEIWYQGGLAQMMAAALVPWLFHGLVRAAYHPSRRALLAVALPFAGIALSHLPILYIAVLFFAPAAVLVPLWAARHDVRRARSVIRRWLTVAGGLLLGLGLSAIMLLPMAHELKYIRASQEDAENISYLKSRFLQPYEVFSQPGPVDLTDLNFPAPKTLGLVGGLLGTAGLLALAARKHYALALLLALALAAVVFMLLENSLDVWLAIPHFRQLRFPERFLRFGALWLALAGGSALIVLPARWQKWGLALGVILALGAALPMIYGTDQFVRMDHLTALDEINFELNTHIWGTTSYDEYDPVWGDQIPLSRDIPEPEQYITDPLRIVAYRLDLIRRYPDLQAQELNTNTIRLTLTQAAPVRFYQYYFPGWTARLDGRPVAVYPEKTYGLLTIDVPAGEHTVVLRYQGTRAQHIAAGITLLSLGLCAGLVLTGKPHPTPSPWKNGEGLPIQSISSSPHNGDENQGVKPGPGSRLSRRVGLAAAGGVIAFALLNTLIITPHTQWFRHRSSPESPAYMDHAVHQSFGDAFELVGYSLHEDQVAPGGKLRVTLFWRPLKTVTEEYRPRVQLVNGGVSEAWASDEQPFPGAGIGYAPDRFTSDVHTLTVSGSAPPAADRLSVQLVQPASGDVLRLPDGSDRLLLDLPIRVTGSGQAVKNTLHYDLGQQVELRCASITSDGQQLDITLYWHVKNAPHTDLSVLVHGLDAAGTMIGQNDGPPLGQDYPAHLWQSGQNLVDHHTLPADPALTTIGIGLYTPAGRLRVTQNGKPVPDDRILLPIAANACPGE